jgi:hypothetical protein
MSVVSRLKFDRRRFVVATAALAASPLLRAGEPSEEETSATLFLCTRDCAGLLRSSERNGDIIWFNGDVTSLWSSTLRPLWRTGEARVAGVTRPPALFCLEQLARGMRHRVADREFLDEHNAVRWLIAPVRAGRWA